MKYIPKHDKWYYGEIPKNLTYERLIEYIRAGVLKYIQDRDTVESTPVTGDEIYEVVNRWFEHDANTENRFDYIVPRRTFNHFLYKILATPQPLLHNVLDRYRMEQIKNGRTPTV